MKPWTKKGREKYAACTDKANLADLCGVSRQSLSGYAHSVIGHPKATQTPETVAATLSTVLGIPESNFGQRTTAKKGGK